MKIKKILTFDEVNGVKRKQYCIYGVCILTKEWCIDGRKTKILGITISNRKYKSLISWKKLVAHINNTDNKNISVVFDHSWGGGTETYFFNRVKDLRDDTHILRVQFWPEYKSYTLTSIYKNNELKSRVPSFDELSSLLRSLKLSKITINNLVLYNDIPLILNLISDLKKDNSINICGHDYYYVCPSCHLLNYEGEFCKLPDISVCKKCVPQNVHAVIPNKDDKTGSKSSAVDIISWRTMWNNFFETTLDEMIVFSDSSRDIFTSVYPVLKNKIKVIPHKISPLRPVSVKKQKHITIGILGNIQFIKGSTIVEQMMALSNPAQVHFLNIGTSNKKNIPQTGKYKVEELPDLIEKHNVDIILIPSICPETFSYTTAEAMSMDLPVACFNLGAPAERLKNYKKGLVIDEIDAKAALQQIIDFMEKRGKA